MKNGFAQRITNSIGLINFDENTEFWGAEDHNNKILIDTILSNSINQARFISGSYIKVDDKTGILKDIKIAYADQADFYITFPDKQVSIYNKRQIWVARRSATSNEHSIKAIDLPGDKIFKEEHFKFEFNPETDTLLMHTGHFAEVATDPKPFFKWLAVKTEVGSAIVRNELLEAITESVEQSKTYSDNQLMEAKEYIDTKYNQIKLAQVPEADKLATMQGIIAGFTTKIETFTTQIAALQKAAIPIGFIGLLPFISNELPYGYYLCNGSSVPVTSPAGVVLKSMTLSFKSSWDIVETGGNITFPNMIYANRSYFLRAVNGTSEEVGKIELDAFQGHKHGDVPNTGGGGHGSHIHDIVARLKPSGTTTSTPVNDGFSGVPRTANETRPTNKGMTPVIYLGV